VLTTDLSSSDRFIGKPEVLRIIGFSGSTLWREIQAGRFPAPVPISAKRVAFLESEVRAWIANKAHQTRRTRVAPRGVGTLAAS
jgi:prophage regulatory protein